MKKTERPDRTIEQQIRRRTIVAFTIFAMLTICTYSAWKCLYHQPQESGIQKTLRRTLNTNETIFAATLSDNNLAKTFPKSRAAKEVRVNGDAGMDNNFDPKIWKMKVIRKPGDTLFITLDNIKKLPKTELIFDFKCIEGWSQISHWSGVQFSVFAKHYGLNAQTQMEYIGLSTPDKKYYVGIDMASALHPQTLLCYELNDKPLPMDQGFPLRLIIPVKYGVKSIKRIGTLYFSNERPPDYWAEKGYDYFSGL